MSPVPNLRSARLWTSIATMDRSTFAPAGVFKNTSEHGGQRISM